MAIKDPTPNLMNLLTRQQFRTAILVTIGLKNGEIAEFLGTTELCRHEHIERYL